MFPARRRSPGQTTVPAASGSRSAKSARGLCVRWVYPSVDRPPTPLTGPAGRQLSLGRGDDCDVCLPGAEISRRHAELGRDGPLWVLTDLKSRNGVYVRGERADRAVIGAGDLIRLGEWIGLVREEDTAEPGGFGTLDGKLYAGPTLTAAIAPALKAATSDLPIVLVGETGAGKEVVARAIHARSGRTGEFVGVNSAALPEALAEAELFGHRKGAFTGAVTAGTGYFRAAHQGTLLLDEIADLPATLQPKLLRALELREVVPVGETSPVKVDLRVIAAAQVPLQAAVKERRFRADLCARLEGLTVRVPPLRERAEEIPFLFGHFLSDAAGGKPPPVEPALIERLCLYDWPFNVRELALLARRLLAVHGDEPLLKASHLPERIAGKAEAPAPSGRSKRAEARDDEHLTAFVAALRDHEGNVAQAARAVGISRQRAYRLMGAASSDDDEPRK